MEPRPTKVIAKDQVNAWLARLLADSEVIAPTTSEFGDEVMAPVSSPADVLWRFSNPLHPPKQFLLPQTEPLVAIRRDGDGWQVRALLDERPRVLFNLRPCDAAGLAFLRRVHEVEPPDAAVLRRAAARTVVCLACPEPCPQGFCICSGAGPFAAENFDVQLVDLGDALLAEAGSERGAALLAAAGPLFRPATPVGDAAADGAGGAGEAELRRGDLPLRLGDAAGVDRPGRGRAMVGDGRLVPRVRRLQLPVPDMLLLLGRRPVRGRRLPALSHLGFVPVRGVHARGVRAQPARRVIFYNRFVELEELKEFIGAADLYLTPYLNEAQITSGTLAYAFGNGNAVVSTPYWHAAELLTAERGKLVPFRDARAIAVAVVDLLRDEPMRHSMRKNAYKLGRDMVWSRVAQLYVKSFEQALQDHNFLGRKLSPIKTRGRTAGPLAGAETGSSVPDE